MGKLYVGFIDGNLKEGGVGGNDWDFVPSEQIRLGIRVVNSRHASILTRRRGGVVHIKSTLGPGCLPAISGLKAICIPGHKLKGGEVGSRNERVIHGFYHREM